MVIRFVTGNETHAKSQLMRGYMEIVFNYFQISPDIHIILALIIR